MSWSRSETRCNEAATFRPQNLDDLAALIDRAVHRAPHTGHLHRGFIDVPAITNTATTRPRHVDHERGEALHPPVNRDVNDLDAAFGQEFFNIAVRQARAEVPASRQHHHVGREPEPCKRPESTTVAPTTTIAVTIFRRFNMEPISTSRRVVDALDLVTLRDVVFAPAQLAQLKAASGRIKLRAIGRIPRAEREPPGSVLAQPIRSR